MEVKLYFRMLQRSWWIIVIVTLATVIAALVASYFTPPTYRATARFVVSPSPSLVTGGSNLLNSLSTLDKRSIITTYAEILNSQRMYNETLNLLQLNGVDLSQYKYSAVALPDANIIEFSVTGPDRNVVYTLANGIGQHTVEYVHSLYQVYDLNVLDPASAPAAPISPQPVRSAGVALVVGAMLMEVILGQSASVDLRAGHDLAGAGVDDGDDGDEPLVAQAAAVLDQGVGDGAGNDGPASRRQP